MEGLFGLIKKSGEEFPENIFIRSSEGSWTYSQVYYMSLDISGYLAGRGVQKGDRVVIFCDNSIQYVAALFGIFRSGAVAVPVNPAKMTESLLYIIEKCSPKLIIAAGPTLKKLAGISESRIDIVDIEKYLRYQDHRCDGNYDSVADNAVDEDDAAMILFTSGTTAYPKGVTLTHGNLLANTGAIMEYLKLTHADSMLMTLPFTYSYGNSILLTHACAGATIIIENLSAYPFKVLEGIRKHEVTGFSTVGSYINLMLKYVKNSNAEVDYFKALRYITFAGESTNNGDVLYISRNYPHMRIYVMYGQTEASARLSYLNPKLLHEKIGSVGKGLGNVVLRVVDGSGNNVIPGQAGEIIAHGPSIMKGYWNDPEATGEVLRGGWLYTGDIATVDEDRFIYIKGRKSDMIKHMGHRISPVEIESVINGCEYVRESAVVEAAADAVPVIKAFIVPEKEGCLDEIRKYARSKLPVYMRPQVFNEIDRLPRTESGKIRRSALRQFAEGNS